jgi:hypothetical protein
MIEKQGKSAFAQIGDDMPPTSEENTQVEYVNIDENVSSRHQAEFKHIFEMFSSDNHGK